MNNRLKRTCIPHGHLWLRILSKRSFVSSLAFLLAVGIGASGVAERGSVSDASDGVSIGFQTVGNPPKSQLFATAKALTHRLRALAVDGSASVVGTKQIVMSYPMSDNAMPLVRDVAATDQLYFRPVLCYAPPYQKPAATIEPMPTTAPTQTLPANCTSQYQLVTANLEGSAGSGTGVRFTVATTPALAEYPSSRTTTFKYKNENVLLPGLTDNVRYLLGPVELSGQAVKHAVARKEPLGRWVVNMRLTPSGTTEWNGMANKYFHEVIGVELDGVVQSAPLTLPNTATFKPFSGNVQISGNFTKFEAQELAMAATWGALPVHLQELYRRTVGTK